MLQRLSKGFGALKVIDDISVDAGAMLGIIGPNGAGKTMLFNPVGGELRPDAGRVLPESTDIGEAPPHQRCRRDIHRMRLGRAFRVTSDDSEAAALVGIDNRQAYTLATGIAVGILGIAGIFHGMRTTIAPGDGLAQRICGFEAVIIAGMGSFWCAVVGGIVPGVAQSSGFRVDPGCGILMGDIVFVTILGLKPNGLFPKTR